MRDESFFQAFINDINRLEADSVRDIRDYYFYFKGVVDIKIKGEETVKFNKALEERFCKEVKCGFLLRKKKIIFRDKLIKQEDKKE